MVSAWSEYGRKYKIHMKPIYEPIYKAYMKPIYKTYMKSIGFVTCMSSLKSL